MIRFGVAQSRETIRLAAEAKESINVVEEVSFSRIFAYNRESAFLMLLNLVDQGRKRQSTASLRSLFFYTSSLDIAKTPLRIDILCQLTVADFWLESL